jgi:hypothetical protein
MTNELVFASESDWFAVDAHGRIALLSSSFGPIPAELAWKEDDAPSIRASLLRLQESSSIRTRYAGMASPDFVELGIRGVFCFAWSDYNGPYLPVIWPAKPISLGEIGDGDVIALIRATFPSISFTDINEIRADDVERCDVKKLNRR